MPNEPDVDGFSDEELQQFYSDICGVVEDHGDNDEQMVNLIDSLQEYRQAWMDTYAVTGTIWTIPPEDTVGDQQ